MNKLIMTALISAAIVPSMIFARQGADDMFEGGHRSSGHTGSTWSGVTWTGATWTGSIQSGVTMPPKMGSGMMMNPELQGLHMAMGKLSSADKATLITMIKEYLKSKGVTVEAVKEVRKEIKEARKDAHEEIKEIRKDAKEEIKAKRDTLKAKLDALKAKRNDFNSSRSNREKGN